MIDSQQPDESVDSLGADDADRAELADLLAAPSVDDAAVRAALEQAAAQRAWLQYEGPCLEKLREQLSAMHGGGESLLCSSGTVAVELALRGVRVTSGDEVILAGYDFPGNFRAVEAIGARPVLADIDPGSWCLDIDAVQEAVSDQTRAVIVSHLHGGLADMQGLRKIADAHGFAIIEDACQTPGADVQGRVAGTWGDAGILSFGGSKLLAAGRGGTILTKNAALAQRIRIWSDRGNQAFPLSELQAAVLIPQLDVLRQRNRQREDGVRRLLELCDGKLPQTSTLRDRTLVGRVFYKLPWRVDLPAPQAGQLRDKVVQRASRRGLPLGAGFRGFVDRGARRCRKVGALTHSRHAAEATVVLHHVALSQPEAVIKRVAMELQRALQDLS